MVDLQKSRCFSSIQKRIELFTQIEDFLDRINLIFRYNRKSQNFSVIEAEYLLSIPLSDTDVYIFLDQHPQDIHFFCRSFFPKENKDYTKGQAIYTLLKKEKIIRSSNTSIIQFDRLSSQKTSAVLTPSQPPP